MASVQLCQVDKVFPDGTHAVRGLTLDVNDGELLVLVGPSGCGKTTTLRMIAGLEHVTGGEIRIAGRVMGRLAPHRRNVAMVFQNYALDPHRTVRGNLDFPLRLRKVPKADRRQRIPEVARLLGLTSWLDRRPGELSGGQQQRVAIARSLIRRPAVSLMDEPLSNLDPPSRVQLRSEIVRIHQRRELTTVYVTHDQAEAMTVGDRVAVMSDGRLQQVGKATDVYEKPASAFVARFFGSPGMNILRATLRHDDQTWVLQIGSARLPIPSEMVPCYPRLAQLLDQQVLVGLRPEALSLSRPGLCDGCLSTPVLTSESLGHQNVLYLENPAPGGCESRDLEGEGTGGGHPLAVRLPAGGPTARAGEKLALRVDTAKMTFFDQQGRTLRTQLE